MNIGKNIKNIRELKGLSQESMSRELNLSQKTYSNIENSKNNISYERIIKIAEVLEVTANIILELNTEVILNDSHSSSTSNRKNNASEHNCINKSQVKLYERIIAEKDKLLTEKDIVIELLRASK